MSTTHDRRGRHRQVARNVTIAVAAAALTGSGAAMAADGGSAAPPTTKAPAGDAASAKKGPKTGSPAPLRENEPVVIQARAALARLVADGAIEQAEADVVMRGVIAGRVDEAALVRAGDVSAAHMPTIIDVLKEVKRANAPTDG